MRVIQMHPQKERLRRRLKPGERLRHRRFGPALKDISVAFAVAESIGAVKTEELAVMVDTFAPLKVAREAVACEDSDYWRSWAADNEEKGEPR